MINSIADLFASGEQGVWFDNRDTTKMWADSARTTLVQNDGDTVAVQWSQAFGANLWTNPTPAINNAGGNDGAYDQGTSTMSNSVPGATPNGPIFQFNITLTTNSRYEVTGQLSGDIDNITRIRIANSGTDNDINYDPATGVISGSNIAGGLPIEFIVDGREVFSIKIESLIVRAIPDIYREQTVANNRPFYRVRSDNKSYLDFSPLKSMFFIGSASGMKYLHDGTGMTLMSVIDWGHNLDADRYLESFDSTSEAGIRINKAVSFPEHQCIIARGVSGDSIGPVAHRAALTGDVSMLSFTYEHVASTGTIQAYRDSSVNTAAVLSTSQAPSTADSAKNLLVLPNFEAHEYHLVISNRVFTQQEHADSYEYLAPSFMRPVPAKQDLGLFLIGQSNMVGAARFNHKIAESPEEGVYMYGKDNVFKLATEPTHYSINMPTEYLIPAHPVNLNPGSGWAVRLAKHLKTATGKTSMIVPAAVGGTSIAEWDTPDTVDDTTTLFGSAVTRYNDAKSRFSDPIIFIYGHESTRTVYFGELNVNTGGVGTSYRKALETYLTHIREHVGNHQIFMVQLSSENELTDAEQNAAAGEAMRQMEISFPNTHMVVAFDVTRNADPDDIHVHRDGQDIIADRMALAVRQHHFKENVNGTGPRISSTELLTIKTLEIAFTRTVNDSPTNYGDLFRVFSQGTELTVTSVARSSDDTRIVITTTEDMVKPVTVSYGYKAGPDNAPITDIVKDTDGLPLPVFGPLVVVSPRIELDQGHKVSLFNGPSQIFIK